MTLFRKQLFVTAGVMFCFLFFGFLATILAAKIESEKLGVSPLTFLAKATDRIAEQERCSSVEALKILKATLAPEIDLDVVTEADLPEARDRLPRSPYESTMLGHPPFDRTLAEVIKLRAPGQYLRIHFPIPPPFLGNKLAWFNFASLLIAVLLASTVSATFLLMTLRKKARVAEKVLADMQTGNLKARFPIDRVDEAGHLMIRFNEMADEIENLVERLKSTESARMRLLQELAHDLRTPVASLRSMQEMLLEKVDDLSRKHRIELTTLSLKEIDYFGRLVEDLLFLAQVTDPRYHAERKAVDLIALIEQELGGLESRHSTASPKLSIVRKFAEPVFSMSGDVHLLQRLLRNAIDNAASFAKSRLEVCVSRAGAKILVEVMDDGPGVTDESIKAFGEKRISRMFDASTNGRVSVGLGSVIMRAVSQVHGGSVQIQNAEDPGAGGGTKLTIVLNSD